MATLRTFVAVEISPQVLAGAERLIKRLSGTPARVRWVAPSALHMTLSFLGEVDVLEIPRVCERVAAAARPFAPFEVESRGAGAFPNLHNPRTIWIGCGRGGEELIRLQAAVEAALAELGFRPEARRFRPHLTIGRMRGDPTGVDKLATLLEQNHDYAAGATEIDAVVVMSSDLTREGPIYEPLGTALLEG